ncbi:MAG: DUF47 family protein [Desulfobacterales bacterium]|nr:DUF47 family protein [Desulfobacterales bacterium]
MFNIITQKTGIEKEINAFLDQVSQSGLLFRKGVRAYLDGKYPCFEKALTDISDIEHKGDALKKSIIEYLHTKTLIPESRGDVLELLESMDSMLDRFKGALWRVEIERPEIDACFVSDFSDLIDGVVESVEAMVSSSRAFFTDIASVRDHLHKVSFWETECDQISVRLRRTLFRKEGLRLSHRMLLSDLIRHIEKISDRAEDAADRMGIYVIKRSL